MLPDGSRTNGYWLFGCRMILTLSASFCSLSGFPSCLSSSILTLLFSPPWQT
uniref:Uncharacterized protein n=1 Tax=Arundo donax TaxID=35708 RepID=A0A0A9AYI8_ARUDO